MDPQMTSLHQGVAQLTQQYEQLHQEHQRLATAYECAQRQHRQASRRMRLQAGLAFLALMAALLLSPSNRAVIAQGYGVTLASLDARMRAVENKTQYISVSGGEMHIAGTNLHIEDGGGKTNSDSGKGNLIIGYNALRNDGTDNRTGTHNLI